jgi:hypothetical protein
MSLFESFLGHAAGTGAQIIGDQIKADTLLEKEREVMKMREALAIEREKTILDVRRAANMQAGQEISAEAEKIGKTRTDKEVQSKMAADPELNGMQPGDQEALDNASPSQLKEAGLLSTFSRSAKLDDRATAAENLGYLDQAKEVRGQQQIENARVSEERRTAAMDNQATNAARLADIRERDLERKTAADKSDREVADKRLNATLAKLAGGGSKDDTKEWLAVVNEQRKGVAAELAQIRADKKAELEGVIDPAERKAISSKFDSMMKPIASKIESIDEKLDAVTNRLAGKANAPVIEKKPEKTDAATSKPPITALKEGKVTTFANGQKWTIKNGQQVQVN